MPAHSFTFKRFAIRQDKTAMKAGTDGVLLGAWCDLDDATQILDIGTGTGLIALMCAQRAQPAEITAIEIDQDAYNQAVENVNESCFKDRINVVNADFKDFYKGNTLTFSHIHRKHRQPRPKTSVGEAGEVVAV